MNNCWFILRAELPKEVGYIPGKTSHIYELILGPFENIQQATRARENYYKDNSTTHAFGIATLVMNRLQISKYFNYTNLDQTIDHIIAGNVPLPVPLGKINVEIIYEE